ncbi:MAG: bifunctional diaminohydroxyphosphoribosylaminopyrimidine deaminase/5-amino-6-(5-phosphoribosylamino)uracil reductase RibD [Dysgonamonadaceae bacterium]|jgi:diaminohydroxyphosphoribosylaminopyrimidine deaminase/5-amino-6-(5-phosphoribosylamino)uracil reductase|nr:bifunctional diaminohydroxyphosphoribosylaminopyrimidine deaminase/5-amino-6-(5-phosphoribosylamino)uracil reductase RibD [Dysgonamonadaceae bacterium]
MDEKYMQRCIQLALNGKGFVAPNPMVGAVIVYNDKIIGEGFHRQYGEAHAEVNAIASVADHSLLKHATLYVNLEPCSHHGKTPPCSELIISKGIPKVVVGCLDPFPEVSGRGIRMMQEAGIEVKVGVLENECRNLNKRFLTYIQQKRPYIILKWAQSADGFLDKNREIGTNEKPVRLSNDFTQMMVHRMRAEESAIIVGTRTALLDNPSLTTRFWSGKNPLRILIDKELNIPSNFHLLDGTVSTLIYTNEVAENKENIVYKTLDFEKDILPQIMNDLYERKIQSLIVEGGRVLLGSFIQLGLWDEACVETVSTLIKSGIPAPYLKPCTANPVPFTNIKCKLSNVQKCENSIVSRYENSLIN